MTAAIDNLNNANNVALSKVPTPAPVNKYSVRTSESESSSSNRDVGGVVLNAAPPMARDKPTPAPRFSILANPEVEAIKGSVGATGSPLSSRYSTPSGDSQAGNQMYEDPWDSGAKQRELEEKLSKRATALASACERVSPSGE